MWRQRAEGRPRIGSGALSRAVTDATASSALGPASAIGGLVALTVALGSAITWAAMPQGPVLAVRRCVSPDPRLAWLGVHLEVLREHPQCAAGQFAVDPSAGHAAGLVVMVTAPTLLANLVTLLGVAGFWLTLRRVLARAADVLRRVVPRLPTAPPAAPVLRVAGPPAPAMRLIRPWQLDRSPVHRRGPPAFARFA